MSLCSLSYLVSVLDRASAILCGSDTVTCPVTGRFITPLPHDIVQMLKSPYLNWIYLFVVFVVIIVVHLVCCLSLSLLLSLFVVLFLFPPLEIWSLFVYSLCLRSYCCVHWKRGLPILVCFGSHYKYSGSCGVPSNILGWQMARWCLVPS